MPLENSPAPGQVAHFGGVINNAAAVLPPRKAEESSNIDVPKLTNLNHTVSNTYQCSATMSCPVCNHFADFEEKLSSEGSFERGTYLEYRKSGQNGCHVCLVIWRSLFGFVQKLGWHEHYERRNPPVTFSRTGITFDLEEPWRIELPEVHIDTRKIRITLLSLSPNDALPEPWPRLLESTYIIPMTPDSPECYEQIKEWIAECEANHPRCGPRGRESRDEMVPLPTRLIDVNPTPNGLSPFLLETQGALGRYVALSYMWGNGLPLKLTKQNLNAFKSSIPWGKIPKTLQDAMIITHRVGLRYIWIDSLTIIQDDRNDWEVEAKKMADVYSNAYFTISAAESIDCHYGILNRRDASIEHIQVWPPLPDQKEDEVKIVYSDELLPGRIYARRMWSRYLRLWPVDKRAWTFQERILSPRVLCYSRDEIVWSCRCATATELWPWLDPTPGMDALARALGLDSLFNIDEGSFVEIMTLVPRFSDADEIEEYISDPDNIKEYLSDLWCKVVEQYTTRHLTFLSDKLPAIFGVAAALRSDPMRARHLGAYHGGIFEGTLPRALAWRTIPSDKRQFTYQGISTSCQAPTWSWASVESYVLFVFNRWESRAEDQCKLVAMDDKEITLRGYVVATEVECITEGHMASFGLPLYNFDCSRRFVRVLWDMSAGLVAQLPKTVMCLLLGYEEPCTQDLGGYVLVLVPVANHGQTGVFQRVGIALRVNRKCFEGAEEREITII